MNCAILVQAVQERQLGFFSGQPPLKLSSEQVLGEGRFDVHSNTRDGSANKIEGGSHAASIACGGYGRS